MGKVPRKGGSEVKKKSKSVKSQIRGIERLLKKDDLPATVRESQERMLAMLRGDNQDNRRQLQEQRMQKKYRMVRFFEKRKLARRIQQCFAKLSSASDDERPRLEDNLAELQKDYNYVEHFPKAQKYISLLAEGQSEKALEHKAEIRQSIADQVSAGRLPNAGAKRSSPKE